MEDFIKHKFPSPSADYKPVHGGFPGAILVGDKLVLQSPELKSPWADNTATGRVTASEVENARMRTRYEFRRNVVEKLGNMTSFGLMHTPDAGQVPVCVYRAAGKPACGIGQLIADHAYSPRLEGMGAHMKDVQDAVQRSYPNYRLDEKDFSWLLSIQRFHDNLGRHGRPVVFDARFMMEYAKQSSTVQGWELI